jgi:hypothetical protein
MTATLSRVWPEIATTLNTDLEQQFHGQAKYKKNQNIESRLRTARYIGELTKFRIAPPMWMWPVAFSNHAAVISIDSSIPIQS